MSPKLQVKLLRVLQEREFERVGESRTIRVDTRVIAATNQFLEDEIEAGRFRDDLYYRLNVVPIYLPPLRERREDIPALARYFLERYSEENRREPPELRRRCVKILLDLRLAGQRPRAGELHGASGGAGAAARSADAGAADAARPAASGGWRPARGRGGGDLQGLIQQLVRAGIQTLQADDGNLNERMVDAVERELIEQVMQSVRQRAGKAAKRLGINRNTLHKKVSDYKRLSGRIRQAQPPTEPEA